MLSLAEQMLSLYIAHAYTTMASVLASAEKEAMKIYDRLRISLKQPASPGCVNDPGADLLSKLEAMCGDNGCLNG